MMLAVPQMQGSDVPRPRSPPGPSSPQTALDTKTRLPFQLVLMTDFVLLKMSQNK